MIDFFAIGDIVIDAFIRLKDARVHCNIKNEDCEICMRWGDKIPYESVEVVPGVGNSANAAVAAARLGLSSALRAYVGDDSYARDCTDSLERDHVNTTYMVREADKHTNYHYVLSFESERTILVKHEAFDYSMPDIDGPKWVYLSSLAANAAPYHGQIAAWLQKFPETKLAFQPGTFQMTLGVDALKGIYERTELFVCNKEEAERILKIEPTDNIKQLLDDINALGPKIVVITNDRKGAYARSVEGKYWFIPMYPDERPPKNRTGAGDAFASSVTSALALERPLEEALLWGPVNAMEVVQHIGAQKGLLTRQKMNELLEKAPPEFTLQAL